MRGGAWHPGRGALWLVAAAALLVSWWPIEATRALWDELDRAAFFGLNGTIAWHDWVAAYWAATGDRRFDLLSAVVLLVLYVVVISRDGLPRFREGVAMGAVTLVVLLVVILVQRQLIALERLAPSHVLEPFHSLGDIVSWSRAKEGSDRSFPGDHASVMLILTVLWWRTEGRRVGLIVLGLAVLFTLPRLVSGAHWATDVLVGGGVATLVTVALVTGTPALSWLYRPVRRLTDAGIDAWLAIDRFLSVPGHGPIDPARQVLRGVCIGTADLIPGVSGGSMALILGIYRRLLGAISHVDTTFVRLLFRGRLVEALRHVDSLFLATLFVGLVCALAFFSRVVPLSSLLVEFPEAMFGLFFGLIAASIFGLLARLGRQPVTSYGWLVLGVGAGLMVSTMVPLDTPDDAWFLFLCGLAAVAAMLVPGVSGAFVLLVLGKYADAVDALGRIDLAFITPLAAGAVVGALLFSRAISWLLDRFHNQTMLTVIGVLAGSLLAVWPFQERYYEMIGDKMRLVASDLYLPGAVDYQAIAGVTAMALGLLLYRLIERLAERARDPEEQVAEGSAPMAGHIDRKP